MQIARTDYDGEKNTDRDRDGGALGSKKLDFGRDLAQAQVTTCSPKPTSQPLVRRVTTEVTMPLRVLKLL